MTVGEVRQVLAIPEGVSDAQVQFAMDAATNRVKRDGVSTTHSDYNTLLVYAVGSYLVGQGVLRNGVQSESIADIKVSYGDAGGRHSASMSYDGQYTRLLNSIVGLTSTIA